MMTRRALTLLLLALALPAAAPATPPPAATKPASTKPANTPEDVTKMIDSQDPEQYAAARKLIDAWLARGRVPKDLYGTWLPSLLKQKRYDEVLTLTLAGIAANPETKVASNLLEIRARALLLSDKPVDALAAAKSGYNVCDFKRLNGTMLLYSAILSKPQDAELAKRLLDAQQPGKGDVASLRFPPDLLASIKIDPAPFAPALAAWKAKDKKFPDRLAYGNLLLITDQLDEAETHFRALLASTINPNEHTLAAEAVARTLRARDGNTTRADDFLKNVPAPDTAMP